LLSNLSLRYCNSFSCLFSCSFFIFLS
jgi:hypothetical protein